MRETNGSASPANSAGTLPFMCVYVCVYVCVCVCVSVWRSCKKELCADVWRRLQRFGLLQLLAPAVLEIGSVEATY